MQIDGYRVAFAAALLLSAAAPSIAFAQEARESFLEYEQREFLDANLPENIGANGNSAPVFFASGPVSHMWEGISQYDVRNVNGGGSYIPPDTMGAVGRTQFFETSNGAYAVYDKATGAQLLLKQDKAWWQGVGQTGSNGDSRVMYNAAADRWIVTSFGTSVADINVAISDTSDALGGWHSLKFTGFAGGTADYPTLALDSNAVYVGTNNFSAGGSFRGTTLNVIPIASLFSATPTTSGMKQFVTPYPGTGQDFGYAIQGVNSTEAGTTGNIAAVSLFQYDNITYTINGLTPTSATGSTRSAVTFLGVAAYGDPNPAHQPSAINPQVIDALDSRISSSVYESGGRIYMVQAVDDGAGYDRIRYTVIDSATNAILDEGDIGEGAYDYYQGAIAVNAFGEVVITYNRSGADPEHGKISVLARMFSTDDAGKLVGEGSELLLHVSNTADYHNGSTEFAKAAGRQRWGDYAQVTVDPTDPHTFYAIGEFAREWNNAAGGHPTGTGGSSWGTWISALNFPTAVPEPSTWAMMISGFGLIGGALRRRRAAMAV